MKKTAKKKNNKGILSLDIATKTGWAYRSAPDQPLSKGTFKVVTKYYGEGGIMMQFAQQLNALFKVTKPQFVYIEAPFLREFASHGRKAKQNMNTAKRLLRFTGVAHLCAASNGVADHNVEEVMAIAIKRYMTGVQTADKDDMIFKVRERGYDPTNDQGKDDDDIADAIALNLYAASDKWGVEL